MKASTAFVSSLHSVWSALPYTPNPGFSLERNLFDHWHKLCAAAPGGRSPRTGNWVLYDQAYKDEDLNDAQLLTALKRLVKSAQ